MKLTIKQPCHISWNELDTTAQANLKYCSTCIHCVHDFRTSTEQEIIDTLSHDPTKKVCGILPDHGEDISSNSKLLKFRKHTPAWLMVLIVLLASCKTKKDTRRGNPGYIEIQDISDSKTEAESQLKPHSDHSSD
ncbi:MAG: hypothetical protein AB8B53_06110 [Flavobacteriales bacterium]